MRAETAAAPKALFVPVSTDRGAGEYMRSLCLARALSKRWTNADVRFVVSEQAPYASDVPFRAYKTPTSPTKHIDLVNEVLSDFRPDVAVFDSAGRAAQLRHASDIGCRTVYIGQHNRKRRRGFRLRRMRQTDELWLVQPKFVLGDLSWLERRKLRRFGRMSVSFIGPILAPPEANGLERPEEPYFLACAGGGGHKIRGSYSGKLFADAAAEVARRTGMPGVVVLGPTYPGPVPEHEGLTIIPETDDGQLSWLLEGATFGLVGGGSLLGQSFVVGTPVVAAPLSKDQPARIRAYSAEGLCLSAEIDTLADVATERLAHEEVRAELQRRMLRLRQPNGLDIAMERFDGLFTSA